MNVLNNSAISRENTGIRQVFVFVFVCLCDGCSWNHTSSKGHKKRTLKRHTNHNTSNQHVVRWSCDVCTCVFMCDDANDHFIIENYCVVMLLIRLKGTVSILIRAYCIELCVLCSGDSFNHGVCVLRREMNGRTRTHKG